MATTRSRKRWAVRLSITRRGGWYAWGPISGEFERSLAAQAGSAVPIRMAKVNEASPARMRQVSVFSRKPSPIDQPKG